MASSGTTGKLDIYVEIKASPQQFHDMFTNRPHHVHHTSSDKIQGCDLHDGEFGKVGTILNWTYVHDGKAKKAKELVEAVDPAKNLITFRVLEGDLLEDYKSFVFAIQASPNRGGSGSVVHWTLEYEKLHEGIDHPESMVEFVKDLSIDIDAHLTKPN
ncbi:MLP-like protein 31 [Hibiscus syriacus]|uniref:MLP-like protein 31 n=1 Tax=Hibiscus syriacus TaxID=106335 RepID=UPI001923989A|nr:MLP-like protein 31 [Hibiscus syriacus]